MRVATVALIMGGMSLVGAISGSGQESSEGDGPRYENERNLVRPDQYRDWSFLSSGLGMTYEVDRAESRGRPELFQNVFVNPSSYRGFMETGRWPDGTVFVLELREAKSEESINRLGRFQGDLFALEAEVKDARFEDGWAFFDFGRAGSLVDVAEPLSGKSVTRCVECHTAHTAVERTFVQFYPTLYQVAQEKGTLNPGF